MNIRISSDLITGIIFLGISVAAIAIISANYSLGTASRMGPGFFPIIVSVLLGGIGALLIGRSVFIKAEAVGSVDARALLLVLASTLFFGLAIEKFGLAVAGIVLIFGARLAGREFKLLEVTMLALILVGSCVFLFIHVLGLNLPHTKFW